MAARNDILSKQIDAVGLKCDSDSPPSIDTFNGIFTNWANLARNLEDGAGVSDLAKENAALELELQALKADFETLKLNHAAQVNVLRTELEALREAQAKRENKDDELPVEQLDILKLLPPPGDRGLTQYEIGNRLSHIPPDELVLHLTFLRKERYATTRCGAVDEVRWSRDDRGNRYVIAMRRSGEDQAPNRKHADLSGIEERILAMMIGQNEGENEEAIHATLERGGGVKITLPKVIYLLCGMEKKGLCNHDPMEATYGTGHTWFLSNGGTEYFAERDKL